MARNRLFFPVGGVGGGPTAQTFHKKLWAYLLETIDTKTVNVGLLTTPSKLMENAIDMERLQSNYQKLEKYLPVKFITLSEEELGKGKYDAAIDVVCITCGNTNGARELWQRYDCEAVIRRYYEQGIPITGYSAGFILFFEWASTDSVPGPDEGCKFGVMQCMGILNGGAIPHVDTQPQRIPDFQKILSRQSINPVLALGEEVMAKFENEELREIVSPIASPIACEVHKSDTHNLKVRLLN